MKATDIRAADPTTGQGLADELARQFALVECSVAHPDGSSRRSASRYELCTDTVEVCVTFPDGTETRALLADWSTDGARLVTDRLPLADQVVRLAVDLGDRRVGLDGTVRHSGSDGAIRHFGVRFLDPRAEPDPGPPAADQPEFSA